MMWLSTLLALYVYHESYQIFPIINFESLGSCYFHCTSDSTSLEKELTDNDAWSKKSVSIFAFLSSRYVYSYIDPSRVKWINYD